ncbi:MAG: MFS transporter [Gammaproteobacteria bacterium]
MLIMKQLCSSLGSALEWFEFAVYGFLGPILSQVFFEYLTHNSWIALLNTYMVFAMGFVARPVGALIFGYIGDRYDRLCALKLTPILLGLTTAAIALLPSAHVGGIASILALILLRLLQGIALGGEVAGNMVYLCELSATKPYLWGSIASCSGCLGTLLASTVAGLCFTHFSYTFMIHYGWRIIFLSAIPLCALSFWARKNLITQTSSSSQNLALNPIALCFKYHKPIFLRGLGVIFLHAISFYFVFTFIPLYLNQVRGLHASAALMHNSAFLLIHFLLIPGFGLITNYLGGLKANMLIAILFAITALPGMYYLAYGSSTSITLILFCLSTMTAANAAIIPGLLTTLIPYAIRYTMLALIVNIGFGIFGGLTPVIAIFLIHQLGDIMAPSLYLLLSALITLTACIFTQRTMSYYETRQLPEN